LAIADKNREVLTGIKVRVGRHASGEVGMVPMEMAREVAGQLRMPMMVHIDHPPPTLQQMSERLRPADVLTHCFRPFLYTPVGPDARPHDSVVAARKRGVLFDIGHGMGSLLFVVVRKMLTAGFPPDTISSNINARCGDAPAFDLTTTLSKFVCLGMSLGDVSARATLHAVRALSRLELGGLTIGCVGDTSILTIVPSTDPHLVGRQRVTPHGIVVNGPLLDTTNRP
jgi:dihydroorotase